MFILVSWMGLLQSTFTCEPWLRCNAMSQFFFAYLEIPQTILNFFLWLISCHQGINENFKKSYFSNYLQCHVGHKKLCKELSRMITSLILNPVFVFEHQNAIKHFEVCVQTIFRPIPYMFEGDWKILKIDDFEIRGSENLGFVSSGVTFGSHVGNFSNICAPLP